MSSGSKSSIDMLARGAMPPDTDRATELCDRILRADPNNLPALELKGKSFWRQAHYLSALAIFERAISLNPFELGYHFLAGDCLQNLRRHSEAIDAFERCRASTDERLASEAEARIAEIEAIQQTLISNLMEEDANFFRLNREQPEATQRSYGFGFACEGPNDRLIEKCPRPFLWARPS